MKLNGDKNTELLIDVIQGCLEAEGHQTKRYSDGSLLETSAYDCIVIKGNDGNYYRLNVDKIEDCRNPHTGEILRASDEFDNADRKRRCKKR